MTIRILEIFLIFVIALVFLGLAYYILRDRVPTVKNDVDNPPGWREIKTESKEKKDTNG